MGMATFVFTFTPATKNATGIHSPVAHNWQLYRKRPSLARLDDLGKRKRGMEPTTHCLENKKATGEAPAACLSKQWIAHLCNQKAETQPNRRLKQGIDN